MYYRNKGSSAHLLLVKFAFLCVCFVVSETSDNGVPQISCFAEKPKVSERTYFGIVQQRTPFCINTTSSKKGKALILNITPETARGFNSDGKEINLTTPINLTSANQIECFGLVFENATKYSINIELECESERIVENFGYIVDQQTNGPLQLNITHDDDQSVFYGSTMVEEPIQNVKISYDNYTLPVVSHNFSLVAIVVPPGNYTYKWSSSERYMTLVSQKDNIATFYVSKFYGQRISVNVSSSISLKTSSMYLFGMKQFHTYQVHFESPSNYLVGRLIKITVRSIGLRYIHYRLIVNGLVEQDKRKDHMTEGFFLTLYKVGVYDIQVQAYMKDRPGFLERYCAKGINGSVQNIVAIKNVITMLDIKLNGKKPHSTKMVFPTKELIEIMLISDGFATDFKVKIATSVHEISGLWNETQQRAVAILNYYPLSDGPHEINITAHNVVSTKNLLYNIDFQEIMSAFQIKTSPSLFYHKVMHTVEFMLTDHNGSSVIYVWDFNDGGSFVTNNSLLPVEHVFSKTGIFNVSVFAANNFSNYSTFISIHVFKDLSSIRWGSTRFRRSIGTNEVFPINLTVNSGLPVYLIVDLGNGQVINATIKPHVYTVFFHSYDKPGLYHVTANASNNAGTRLQLHHKVNVQDRVDEIYVKLNSNSSVFCIPSLIEIHGIVRKGSNVFCMINSGVKTIYHDVATHKPEEQHFTCNTTYNLTTIGYYNFTVKMYNNLNEKSAIINSVEGKHPARRSFNVNVTAQQTRIGKHSFLEIHGDFDCPLLKCDFDFGDGSIIALQNVVNGSMFSHKYGLTGEYNISGVCYSHHKQAMFETKALVSDPLSINEVVYQDDCFAIGKTYVVKANFKHAAMKQWRIEINGSLIANPNDIVSDTGLNATVSIPPDIYGDYGDKPLRISVFDDVDDRNILETNLCIRRSTQKVTLYVVPHAAVNVDVTFDFAFADSSVTGSLSLLPGDGDYKTPHMLSYPNTYIRKSYRYIRDYSYSWTLTNPQTIAEGSGIIKIRKPIGPKYLYSFPAWNDLYWPNSFFQFYLSIRCDETPPTDLKYKIDFGDGESSSWLSMPTFDCYSAARLVSHAYKEPECFQTRMEMKNLISREEFTSNINVLQAITSLDLSLNNIPSITPVEKDNSGMVEVYLRDSYPIEVIANTTGGKCLTFNWKIQSLSWTRNTGKNNRVVLNDLVGRNGSFVIEVIVTNAINTMAQQKRIVLMKTIVGLKLLSSLPIGDGVVEFYLLLENTGTNSSFTWRFGDGTSLNLANVEFKPALTFSNILSIEGAANLDLIKFVATVQSHQYTSQGLFVAEVIGKDAFSTVSAKRDVYLSTDKVCKRPTVKIIRKDNQILSFSFAGGFTVLTDVQMECDDSNEVVFQWQLFESSRILMENNRRAEDNKLIRFPASAVTNQRDLSVKKRTIYPGIYIIKITVEMKGLGFSESDEAYIEVTREPLHVEIIGSTTRLLSWEEDIFLDGRNSRDPNTPTATNSSLTYKWYCRVKPGSLQFTLGNGGCFGYGENLVENEGPTWSIPAKKLIQNAVYIIRLRIESQMVEGTFAEVEQFLDVRSGTVISTSVDCKANCQRNIDPETRLSLIGSCRDCGRYKSYRWKLLKKSDFSEVQIRWMTDTLTSQDSVSFVLLPMFLTRNKEYLARFTVTTAWGQVGYADYGFKVSIPPQGGFCNVTPPYGEAIKTKFLISCHNWSGSTQTLQYSIAMLEYTNENRDTAASKTLISYGSASYTEATLQQGQERMNFTQTLIIRISDSYGASTETNLTVQVKPFNARKEEDKPADKPVENQLETYVYGKDSTLSKLAGTGNVQELGRFTKAIGKSLDSAKEESDSIQLDEKEKKERAEKRKNMRTTIVSSLTDVTITNLDNFAVISSALKDVSSSEDEINKGSQDKMLQFFEGASEFLERSYDDWKERDPKEIQNAFQGFLEGVGNVIESAAVASSGNVDVQRSNEQYKKFTGNSLQIIDNSTLLLSRSLVVGEAARRINGESLSIEMKRSEVGRLNSMLMTTMGGGQLQTPSARGFIDANNTNITAVDSKMVTLLRNPHILDQENIGKSLTPTISSLKFLSGDKEMSIANLSNEDQMIIEIPNPTASMVNKSATLTNGKMHLVLLQLPAKGATFFLKVFCYGAPCDVFISYDGVPSPMNYTETFKVAESLQESNQSAFRIYDSLNSTKFNLGILYNTSSSLSRNSSVRFDLEAYVSGCFYWKEIENKWSSDGCKLLNRTTLKRTICQCNHLTWFGGGFLVQPNIIDISVEVMKIKNIADYPALLATVCTIFGVYLLAVIWARRQDKIDALKATLIIPDDCCQSHKFRYDLTITSGSRPGSGTTASVCMILGGNLGESHPFCLSHHSDILFQRGSIDSFLVTSEKDLGDIEYIRLWHDNTGKSPGWFVSRIIVTNIITGKQTQFLCNTWLALGVGNGNIDNVFVAAEETELKSFESIFLNKTSRGFSDDHLWFSVSMRPSRSSFTRVQRVTCCLCALLCTMLANAMFYQRANAVDGANIKIGSFSFNWRQIMIGIQSAFIVLPINVIIVALFRKAAPRVGKVDEESADAGHHSDSSQSIKEAEDSRTSSCTKDKVINDAETDDNVEDETTVPNNTDNQYPFMNMLSEDTLEMISALNPTEDDNVKRSYLRSYCSLENDEMWCKEANHIQVDHSLNQADYDRTRPDHDYNQADHVNNQTDHDSNQADQVRYQVDHGSNQADHDHNQSDHHHQADRDYNQADNVYNQDDHDYNQVDRDHSQIDHDNVVIDIVNSDEVTLINTEDVILEIDEDESVKSKFPGVLLSKDTLDLINHLNVYNNEKSSDDNIINFDHKSISLDRIQDETENSNKLEDCSSHVLELLENTPSVVEVSSTKKQTGGKSIMPRLYQIVAWVLCFSATVVSGFFTLLYGLSFGRKVQEEWLLSFFTSVFQDVFISQPAKVLLIGCVFALIIKKITEDDTLPEVELAKDDDWIHQNLPLQEKRATSSMINIPLTPSYIKKAHEERLQSIKMTDLTLEIITYLIYIFLALLIAYGHRAPNAYDMTDNLKTMIITDKFDKITNTNDFWNWTSTTFLPSIYGEVWYNGERTKHRGFLSDYVTYLIGSPRFRQLRVIPDICSVSNEQYNTGRILCSGEYSSSNEDNNGYQPRWKLQSTNETTKDPRLQHEDPWLYHSQLELNGHPFLADLNTYSGGGYTLSLGKSLSQANSSISYLKENLWIDTQTRAVFIEFTTYNNNDNFYCIVTLLLEFTQDGGIFPFTRIITTRLDRYNSDFSFFLAACEISFLLLTLYYMWLELKKFRRKGILYLKQWDSFVELLLFSLTWATFGLLIIRIGVVNWTKKKYRENPDQFTSFQYAASADLAYGYTLACLIFIAFLKLLKILRFNKNMLLLYKTLQFASKDLRYYGFLFSIPCFGYIQWAYLVFGQQLSGYATYLRSSMSVMNLLLGSANFYDLQSANRIIGPIFFIIFVVTMGFVLMNMFLSIVMQAFAEVRRLMAKEKNKYEIIEFLYEKVIRFFPCLQGQKANLLDTVHSQTKVDEYYQKRAKERQCGSQDHQTFEAVIKRLDIMEDFFNRCLLCEYEELEELSEFALKLQRKFSKDDV